MHLQSTIVATRAGQSGAADSHIAEARDFARSVPDLGHGAAYDGAESSATNVEFRAMRYAVALAVELEDGTTAVARGLR